MKLPLHVASKVEGLINESWSYNGQKKMKLQLFCIQRFFQSIQQEN
jgi:hypothetical protein